MLAVDLAGLLLHPPVNDRLGRQERTDVLEGWDSGPTPVRQDQLCIDRGGSTHHRQSARSQAFGEETGGETAGWRVARAGDNSTVWVQIERGRHGPTQVGVGGQRLDVAGQCVLVWEEVIGV